MPIFDWKCSVCNHEWEQIVKVNEVPKSCPIELGQHLDFTEQIEKHKYITWTDGMGPKIKKLPSIFGKHLSWSKWRAIE